MGVKRAISILFLILLANCAISFLATEKSNISENDTSDTGEFSEIFVEFSFANVYITEFFKEQKFIPKISAKPLSVFVEKGFDLTSIKNSLLIIPSLNLTKLIFPFHFFT